MKKILTILILLLASTVSAQDSGTINRLDQWSATTSPTSAITQRVYGKSLKLSGLSDGCLSLVTGIVTSSGSACGSGGGGDSIWELFGSNLGTRLIDPNIIVNIGDTATTSYANFSPSAKLGILGDLLVYGDVDGGVTSVIANANAGTDAYTELLFQNDLASPAAINYASLSLNSSNYNDSTYGATTNLASGLGLINTMGPIIFNASSSGATTGKIIFATGGSANSNIASVIDSTGAFGVGSTSPTARLTVTNPLSARSMIVEDQTGDTTPFTIDASGNVGVGTLSPSARTHVIGTTEQLRLGYDTSNYVTQTISSGGLLSWQTTAGATAGIYTLTPHGAGGVGTNRTLDFGRAWGNAAIFLYNNGVASRFGWGMNADQMQFFAPTTTGGTFTWNRGGDLQASGTNELLRLTQYAAGTGAGLGMGSAGFAPTTPYRIDFQGVSATGATAGVENILRFSRIQTGGVSYPEAFTIGLGRYSSSGLGPDTRVDFNLKATAATDYTTGAGVMSLNSNQRVLVGGVGAASATLHVASNTSGSGSNAFQIYNAGSALRMSYRDDGRLWLGTGTASYNALLNLDSSGTQTEIQFTTNATGRTSTDGAYLMYSDSIGFRYLNIENKPHVFYIGGSEVARFSETGAIMQVTGTLAAQYSGAGSSRGGTISLISSAGTPQDWLMAVAGNDNSVVNGRSWFLYDNTNSVARFFVDTNGNVGAGLTNNAATARLHTRSTSYPALRGDYNSSNYFTASTTLTGTTIFDAVGTSPSFSFLDNFGIGTTTPTANFQATNLSSNATTSIQFGKANQDKGTCRTEYDTAGSPVYIYIAAGASSYTFQNGGTAPSGCIN